jgi:hypothetical protein
MGPSSRIGIGGANVNNNWNGSPLILEQNDTARMPQTTAGSMIFAWENLAQRNNDGTLSLSSGGGFLRSVDAPWGTNAPSILVNNWQANNLTVVNLSVAADTPIRIQAYGPGMPGQCVQTLQPSTPTSVQLGSALTANTSSSSSYLVFQCAGFGLFGLIGGPNNPPGPAGNNAYVFAVNFPSATTPPGYTATTQSNSYRYPLNWSGRIYVAYFGAGRVLAADTFPGTVVLVPL